MKIPALPASLNATDLGSQQFSRRRFLAWTAAASAAGLGGCVPPRVVQATYALPPLDVSGAHSLGSVAAQHGLLTGFALNAARLRTSDAYRQLAARQCSIAVAENAMKWGQLRPTQDRYSFEDADSIMSFAEEHGIKMRGHNLCWHEHLPTWFAAAANAENARSLLTEHIRTVAGRYAGRMHSWDVVNEAVQIRDGRPDGLRVSPWLNLIGTDYIELAFRTAREADPAALLTYNDYDIEGETEADAQKRTAVLLLLRRLRQRNVPIDAVGIQSHIKARGLYGYGPSLRKFIQSCREMELEVFLTELDVDDRNLPADLQERDAGIAETYRSYLAAALAERNVKAVLTWGIGDDQTWLNKHNPRADGQAQRPLLFDEKLRAKPAFAAVAGAFAARPAFPPRPGTRA